MKITKQAIGYAVVGGCQLSVEWLLFISITSVGCRVEPANVISRFAGALLGYWLNGRYTFANQGTALSRRALIRFSISWVALTLLGTWLIHELNSSYGLRATWASKPVIDILLAGVGFLASRYWIYNPKYASGQ
ncbi:MAG: hypothetical protein DDT26_01603 [Dehalococcoidia bacterium]|nr:hypothetical protein [Chloroflexota bacterium]